MVSDNVVIENGSPSAESLKLTGNEHFKNNEFGKALEFYDLAIEKDPNNAVFYSNRAAAHIKLENFAYALADAQQAIQLDPKFIKAYHRAAISLMAIAKYKEACAIIKQMDGLRSTPFSRRLMTSCQKSATRQAFERAIHTNDNDEVPEFKIDIESIRFDKQNYQGTMLPSDGFPNQQFAEALLKDQREQKRLHPRFAFQILLAARDLLKKQPTLVRVNLEPTDTLTICGDIHGQYYDLLHIFEQNGLPSENRPYLFNGDFVDRGSFSMECILTLLTFKLLYPNRFFLNRGNHEVSDLNEIYGFKGEVESKYSSSMYKLFVELFNHLPLCHLINDKVLVVHGGIPADTKTTLADIEKVNRHRQPPPSGIMAELLWNDPSRFEGKQPSKRGQGFTFGPDISRSFCERNKVKYVVRSHEVKEEGYEIEHDGRVITVFSAPNYCDCTGNEGAYILLKGDSVEKPNFVKFKHSEHPNVPPMAYSSDFFNMG